MKRCFSILLFIAVVTPATGLTLSQALADEYRHFETHRHGVVHMNVGVEGNDLYIGFACPTSNIVGFEHQPRTQEQKVAVKKAVEKLRAGEMLFVLPLEAEAQLVKYMVSTDVFGDFEILSETVHFSEHDNAYKSAHKDSHHNKKDHESDEHECHSGFKIDYRYVCKKPEKLRYIDVMLFRAFPSIKHIEVQLLTDTKQTAVELTVKKNKIIF